MSHIVELALEIKDLDALKKAVSAIDGLEYVENQKTYRWYGTSVGDYPLPAGLTKEDLGKCEHAIRVKNNPNAYEVGVVKRKDGKAGYTLVLDFWAGGHGLCNYIGQKLPDGATREDKQGYNALRIANHYGAQVAVKRMAMQGFRVQIKEDANRKVVATCRKS